MPISVVSDSTGRFTHTRYLLWEGAFNAVFIKGFFDFTYQFMIKDTIKRRIKSCVNSFFLKTCLRRI
jgi:hypothetical protein